MPDMREEVDANYHIGEVKLWNDTARSTQVGVIVEAKSDENIFARFFRKDCMFFCFNGWENAKETIEKVNEFSISGVIGILDADFKRILSEDVGIANVFLVDHHDSEMMMLDSAAWEQVLEHFAGTKTPKAGGQSQLEAFEKKAGKPAIEILLETARPIGCVRLLSAKEKLGLRFRHWSGKGYKYLDYSKFVNNKTLAVDFGGLLKAVENKNSKLGFFKVHPEYVEAIKGLMGESHDPWELCNGHDVMNLFSLALREAMGKLKSGTKVSGNQLEDNLTIAYRLSDFQQTQLYKDLVNWEQHNAPDYPLFRD